MLIHNFLCKMAAMKEEFVWRKYQGEFKGIFILVWRWKITKGKNGEERKKGTKKETKKERIETVVTKKNR